MSPLDLHVLGTPPAFVLSQDQTLIFDLFAQAFALRLFLVRIGIDFAYLNVFLLFAGQHFLCLVFSLMYRFQGSWALSSYLSLTA